MLQWTGGSRRKVTSSRKSVHNRQKQYFEQRKHQQQVPGLQNPSDARKTQSHAGSQSLDILSLENLGTLTDELDVPQVGSHFSQLPPENVSKLVTSRFPEGVKSSSKPWSITPTKISADNSLRNLPTSHGCSSKIEKNKVQTLPSVLPSNCTTDNIKKPCKHEDTQIGHFSEVSVLDLLGDDGINSNSVGATAFEAHVAFSVEGLGKVGMRTPACSPGHVRKLPSPPKAPMRMRSSAKHKSSTYNIGSKTSEELDCCLVDSLFSMSDKFGDEFSNAKTRVFMVSCTPPDAYENQRKECKERIFTGPQKSQPFKGALGFLDDDIISDKFGGEWKDGLAETESYYPSTFKDKKSNSPDYDFMDVFSPRNRNLFTNDKRSNASAQSFDYFRDLSAQSKRRSNNEMHGAHSMFFPPDLSFLGMEDSQDSMSLVSEESCSAAAVLDESYHDLGSQSVKLKKRKMKCNVQNEKCSIKSYDLGELDVDQTDPLGLNVFCHEWNIGTGNNRDMTNHWNSKAAHFSEIYSELPEPNYVSTSTSMASASTSCGTSFMETDNRSFRHKLMREDDLFDSFPLPQHSTSKSIHQCSESKILMNEEPLMNFISERMISKKYSGSDIQIPATFPWETGEHLPCSSFFRNLDKDAEVSGLSRQQNVCQDSEVKCSTPEMPENRESVENNSLSSNGQTAGVADSNESFRANVELRDENQEHIDGPETGNPSVKMGEEASGEIEDVPTHLESCTDDKKKADIDSQAPISSQVATQDFSTMGASKGDSSYQVLLETYVFQLLCVQKVLLEASGKDTKKK